MDYLNPLNLDFKASLLNSNSVELNETSKGPQPGPEHSELAMKAAKRMRRTKYKAKTGHKVCQHLLEMIREGEEQQPAPRTVRRYHGLKESLRHGLVADSSLPGLSEAILASNGAKPLEDWNPANDRQFSLSF